MGGFERDQVRPAAQEVHRQLGVQFADQLEGLGIVGAQEAGELVEDLGAAVHGVAPGLDQAGQFEGLGVLGFQRAEFGGVVAGQFQEDPGVGQVVTGPGGREGAAIAGAGDGVDGINRQPGILDQGVDDGAAAGLDGQGHRASAEAFFQVAQPGVERLGRVGQGAFFGRPGAVLQDEGVGVVAPVQADPGHGRRGGGGGSRPGGSGGICSRVMTHSCLLWLWGSGRSLYSARRRSSAPEDACPCPGNGSGRRVALCSLRERVSPVRTGAAPKLLRSRARAQRGATALLTGWGSWRG